MSNNIFDEFPPESETMSRLHAWLEQAAEADGALDIAYRTIDTPVGTLLLAATSVGLLRVAYDIEGHDAVLNRLADAVSPRILRSPARLDVAARQIDEYFAKRRTAFEVPVDLRLAAGFRRDVVVHLREIGYGRRESYASVAAAIGRPRAVRAVGTACAHNPLPVVLPCHRVVRSDGSTGHYVGGPWAKSTLLDLETDARNETACSVV